METIILIMMERHSIPNRSLAGLRADEPSVEKATERYKN